jgi:hypothetical protein
MTAPATVRAAVHAELLECLRANQHPDAEMWAARLTPFAFVGIGGAGYHVRPLPARIQRKRLPGWRMPAGAVYVGRGSKWGNPARVVQRPDTGGWHVEHDRGGNVGVFPTRDAAHLVAVDGYRQHLAAHPELAAAARTELVGRDLVCWCRPEQTCHADVLIDIANTVLEETR